MACDSTEQDHLQLKEKDQVHRLAFLLSDA